MPDMPIPNDKRRLGIDATLNLNTSGDYEAPTWVTCDLVEELALDEGWASASGNNRGQPIEASAKTRAQVGATGRIMARDTDPTYLAMLAAYRSRDAEVDVMILSGALDSDGATGVRGKFQVHRFSNSIGPNEVQYRDFSLIPAVVAAGEPFVAATVVGGTIQFEEVFLPTAA
jgi:hypothetical protein